MVWFLFSSLYPWLLAWIFISASTSGTLVLQPVCVHLGTVIFWPSGSLVKRSCLSCLILPHRNPPCHLVPLAKAATLASCPVSRHFCTEAFASSTLGKCVVSIYKNKSITEAFIHNMSHTFKLTCCKIDLFGVYIVPWALTHLYICVTAVIINPQNHPITPKIPSYYSTVESNPSNWYIPWSVLHGYTLVLSIFQINRTILCVTFWEWILSLSRPPWWLRV